MQITYLLIAALFVQTSEGVNYNDLEILGAACSPRDTCKISSKEFLKRNCECDRGCLRYDDCCADGPKASPRRPPRKVEGQTCVAAGLKLGVYGVSVCPSTWKDPDVKDKCENGNSATDPAMSSPATDVKSGTTYRSLYCAICNNADIDNLSIWGLQITCNSLSNVQEEHNNITQKFIMANIVRAGNSWGVYHWNNKLREMSFFPCNVGYSIPQSVTEHVRYCRPNVVSRCASNWNDRSVRKDCNSYMGVIYIDGQAYKNAHCALCNHVSLDKVTCTPRDDIRMEWLSFTVILDFKTPEKPKCSTSEQLYDPILKKCHILKCRLPGQVLRNGECVTT